MKSVVCDGTGTPVGHKQQGWKFQYSADPGVLVCSITTDVGQDPGDDSDTGEAQSESLCHSVVTRLTTMADPAVKLGVLGLTSQPGLAQLKNILLSDADLHAPSVRKLMCQGKVVQ